MISHNKLKLVLMESAYTEFTDYINTIDKQSIIDIFRGKLSIMDDSVQSFKTMMMSFYTTIKNKYSQAIDFFYKLYKDNLNFRQYHYELTVRTGVNLDNVYKFVMKKLPDKLVMLYGAFLLYRAASHYFYIGLFLLLAGCIMWVRNISKGLNNDPTISLIENVDTMTFDNDPSINDGIIKYILTIIKKYISNTLSFIDDVVLTVDGLMFTVMIISGLYMIIQFMYIK